ncbi:MAG: acetate--CoA ligase family protein, partial [Solirubrobacterales bacterium]
PPAARPTEAETLAALGAAGVPVARTVVCTDAEAARAAATDAGMVVVKASAPDLPHKSEAGAVVVGVSGPDEVAAAHEEVVAAARRAGAEPEGSIVQEMAGEGIEIIIGARRDPLLGPVLIVGPGGIQAELADEVSRRMLPLLPGEAREMLDELPIAPLLHGYRGRPAADLDGAAAAIEALAALAVSVGERLEALEVNPLVVHPDGEGATAVDALLLLEE